MVPNLYFRWGTTVFFAMSTRWHKSWDEGRIGFHSSDTHSDLLSYENEFLGDTPKRILVPLCGKSVDMVWLADKGHEVIGVELVPKAAEEFFAENALTPTITKGGPVCVYKAGSISILCGDIFHVTKSDIGAIDRVWDRAALVALPPELRPEYVSHLRSICPQAKFLLNAFTYDTEIMDGPPYSVEETEVRTAFSDCEITVLEEADKLDLFPPFRAKGLTSLRVSTYSIEPR